MRAVLRGTTAFVLAILGSALSLSSVLFAFVWPGLCGACAIGLALAGLLIVFSSFWITRETDAAPLAAGCLKFLLASGLSLLVLAPLFAIFGPERHGTPYAYLVITGVVCLLGFLKFRAYRSQA